MSDTSKPKVKRMKKTDDEEIALFRIPLRGKKKKQEATPEKTATKSYWLETQLQNEEGDAIPFMRVDVIFADGRSYNKRSNEYGVIRVDDLSKAGDYRLEFPDLPKPGLALVAENPKGVAFISSDACFAPGTEELSFSYAIKDLAEEKIRFEVLSENFGAGPIYQQLLMREEREDGEHQLSWDGRFQSSEGPPDETQLINPLYGPYRLRIATEDDSFAAEADFSVLYHSLELKAGPWTADEKEPPPGKEEELVQYQLNKLGYYGGPVGKDCDDYLKKAVVRYKANHPDFHRAILTHGDYDDAISAELKAALAAGDQARALPDPSVIADPSAEVDLLVESIYYESHDELPDSDESKVAYEQVRINRPLVPLEVEVLLRSKAGEAVSSPEAVGNVRVNWCVNDKPSSEVDEISALGDQGESAWHTRFLLGDSYIPWQVEKDEQQKVVFSKAYADDDDYPGRLGRAGVFFRPSAIGGDRYSVSAAIDFSGLPNEKALQEAHGEELLKRESSTVQIRRSAKVALLLEWPGREALNLAAIDWASLKEEFAEAGIVLDVDGIQTKKISEVISADEYRDLVVNNTQFSAGANIAFDEGCMMGVPLPEQGVMSPAAYQMHLAEFLEECWNKLRNPLSELLCQKLRTECASGFIVLDFLPHQPLSITRTDSAGGETSVVRENFVCSGLSTSQPGGFIALQSAPEERKAHEMLAHEMLYALAHELHKPDE